MESIPKTFQYFLEAETAALEVLSLKEEILELHRRLSEIREALSEVSKNHFEKGFMYDGGLLIKHEKSDIIEKLNEEFKELNEEIKIKGDGMKEKINRLQELEKEVPFPGRSLIPLDKTELGALQQLWGAQV